MSKWQDGKWERDTKDCGSTFQKRKIWTFLEKDKRASKGIKQFLDIVGGSVPIFGSLRVVKV